MTIICSSCEKEAHDVNLGDSLEGWSMYLGHVRCPDCTIKYLLERGFTVNEYGH